MTQAQPPISSASDDQQTSASGAAFIHPEQKSHSFAPEILRAYDIRGELGKNLSEIDAFFLGRAFGTIIRRKAPSKEGAMKVCIGYDGRESSPILSRALSHGLSECGITVENIGLGPTPMLYFAVKDRMADGGIMVTGSHNPASHNGFKMTLQSGPVFGDDILEIGAIAAAGDFENTRKGKEAGTIYEHDIVNNYVSRLMADFTAQKDLKVAWDCGHGAAGPVLRRLIQHLPGEHILMYDQVDGTFPAHHPDPTVDENLADLRAMVLEKEFDLGIAFDGDADRIGVIDNTGAVIRGDVLVALYAQEILEEKPGAPIIGDVKCSQVLFDEIKRLGGRPEICATGHSIVKSRLNDLKAPLAGELSGHIFFADRYYGFDDALYCGIRLMNIVGAADQEGTLSDLLKNIPSTISTPEMRLTLPEDTDKFDLIDRIKSFFIAQKQARSDDNEISNESASETANDGANNNTNNNSGENDDWDILDIDGIRLTTPQGWLLIRASNTEHVLSLRIEGHSQNELSALKALVNHAMDQIGLEISV